VPSVSRLRWGLKKAARRGIALATWAGGGLGGSGGNSHAKRAPSVLRALTYHGFGESHRDPFCVSQRSFDEQMAHLAQSGRAVSLKQLAAFVSGERDLPSGSLLVTIDDGLASLSEVALPVLRHHAIPAVAFVTASLLRDGLGNRDKSGPGPRYLDWAQLEGLAAAGIDIGSHAWSHRSLGRLDPDDVHFELAESRAVLERRLGRSVCAFAYPFGTLADFNAGTRAALQSTGYEFAFTSQHGVIRRGADRLALPRVKVEGGEGIGMFDMLIRGGLDGWNWVDRTLVRLQASGRAS
jgi:peptidoglycan/xylan/chitin deacetylase (PgdA/CDA1 family)